MSLIFKALHPVFGTKLKRLDVNGQTRSPYYWWWAFLRRNEDYLACCESNGAGSLQDLYADFGDVRSDDFRLWWNQHGYHLFAERVRHDRLFEMESSDQWDNDWDKDTMMVLAVPLTLPKRYIQRFINDLLKKRHQRKQGRIKHKDEKSTARYALFRPANTKALAKQLSVYDAVMAKKRKEHKKTLATIGAELELVKTAMPKKRDDRLIAEYKRNVMTASVSRQFRAAQRIIANTINRQFPNDR